MLRLPSVASVFSALLARSQKALHFRSWSCKQSLHPLYPNNINDFDFHCATYLVMAYAKNAKEANLIMRMMQQPEGPEDLSRPEGDLFQVSCCSPATPTEKSPASNNNRSR